MTALIYGGIDYAKLALVLSSPAIPEQVLTNLEIRDTDPHNSSFVDMTYYNAATIYVVNAHNQDISVQVKGNMIESIVGAVNIGVPFTVTALVGITPGVEARSFTLGTTGWLPYIYLEVTAASAPILGNVNAYVIKKPLG